MRNIRLISQACLRVLFATSCFGCSSAGPVVTDIRAGDNHTLQIEKCDLTLNGFTSQIALEHCKSQQIRLDK